MDVSAPLARDYTHYVRTGPFSHKLSITDFFGYNGYVGLFRALKLEVQILTEADLSDDEVTKWTKESLTEWADFLEVTVKITEKHERIIADFDCTAEA